MPVVPLQAVDEMYSKPNTGQHNLYEIFVDGTFSFKRNITDAGLYVRYDKWK